VTGSGLPGVHAPAGRDPHADQEVTRRGAHVGAARGEPGAARAKVNPKPWHGEQSSDIGWCDPVGAPRKGHIPPDQRRASRSGVHSTCTPSHGRTKRDGTSMEAASLRPARGRVVVNRSVLKAVARESRRCAVTGRQPSWIRQGEGAGHHRGLRAEQAGTGETRERGSAHGLLGDHQA